MSELLSAVCSRLRGSGSAATRWATSISLFGVFLVIEIVAIAALAFLAGVVLIPAGLHAVGLQRLAVVDAIVPLWLFLCLWAAGLAIYAVVLFVGIRGGRSDE